MDSVKAIVGLPPDFLPRQEIRVARLFRPTYALANVGHPSRSSRVPLRGREVDGLAPVVSRICGRDRGDVPGTVSGDDQGKQFAEIGYCGGYGSARDGGADGQGLVVAFEPHQEGGLVRSRQTLLVEPVVVGAHVRVH
jgi:hypothetical protein